MDRPGVLPRLWTSPLLRVGVSLAFLLLLAGMLDVGEVWQRLRGMHPGWALLGVLLGPGQILLLAWRWRFTARRLGLPLSYGHAFREYYLAVLLNQLLPGGVAGDLSRAWRQARSPLLPPDQRGTAIRAVVLERASTQVVMTLLGLLALLYLALTRLELPLVQQSQVALLGLLAALGLGTLGALVLHRLARAEPGSLPGRSWSEVRRAFLEPGTRTPQLLTALLAVGSYLAVFLVAGRAMGVEASAFLLLLAGGPILLTMLIPVSVAGWGVREAAAAALWGGLGLTATEGVAVSVAYGILVLVGSLPGTLVLLTSPPSRSTSLPTPGRRGHRPRG